MMHEFQIETPSVTLYQPIYLQTIPSVPERWFTSHYSMYVDIVRWLDLH